MDPVIRLQYTGIAVNDQAKALAFYTEKLGFELVDDIAVGEYRWLTVQSPAGAEGVQLLLEPTAFPPAKTYQEALYAAGVPCTMFTVDDVDATVEALRAKGVEIVVEPMDATGSRIAMIDDTVGNRIQLVQLVE